MLKRSLNLYIFDPVFLILFFIFDPVFSVRLIEDSVWEWCFLGLKSGKDRRKFRNRHAN